MDTNALRVGFIGAGRLGKALAWHCARQEVRVVAAASRLPAQAEELAARIPGCNVGSAQAVADACDLVFLTTRDGLIRPMADALRWRPGSGVVHCSGATDVSELAKALRDGAHIGGFHPLQTFGDPEAASHAIAGCTITIEASEPLDTTLIALAARLGCRVNRLPQGARALYHAAAGYPSQFINALLREASSMWKSWGATEEDAVQALLPMMRGTLSSIERAGVAGGMPGPVSRGDVGSVAKHLVALRAFDEGAVTLYRELCNRTVSLALERGGIDEATALRFRRLLAGDDPVEPSARG